MHGAKPHVGVSLLEFMLMLGLSAIVVILSLRYYDYARINQQADTVLSMMSAITAAADNLSHAKNTYEGQVSYTSLESILSEQELTTPWGTRIQVEFVSSDYYTIKIPSMPGKVCAFIMAKYKNSQHYHVTDNVCPANGVADFSYTYVH